MDSSDGSDIERFAAGTADNRLKFVQKRSFSLKKRLPIHAVVPLPPELHNTHGLNIPFNPELFGKPNSYTMMHDDESSLDVSSPRDNNSPMVSTRGFKLKIKSFENLLLFYVALRH